MANRKRNIVLRVPVTAEELALIEKKMQQMGTRCFSVYARKMLIDGYVIKIDYSDIKAMTAELQKIGTNINQIARRFNATGTIYAQDIQDFFNSSIYSSAIYAGPLQLSQKPLQGKL